MIWNTISKITHPINHLAGVGVRALIKKIFFHKLSDEDFKGLFGKTLDLIPAEAFSNILILLIKTISSRGNISEVNYIHEIINHEVH